VLPLYPLLPFGQFITGGSHRFNWQPNFQLDRRFLGAGVFRLSGSRETEWEWALEGRRVVPLMPRLLHPSPLTALATAVSKTVGQNPRICLNAVPTKEHRGPAFATRFYRVFPLHSNQMGFLWG